MRKPPLLFFFFLALLALVFGASVFPSTRLITFSPFLAIVFLRKPFLPSLWIGALCGLLVDLFTVDIRFGVFALCSVGTTALTFQLKRYFYEDNLFSIPLYTAAISAVFSTLQFVLLRHLVTFNLQLLLSTLLIMPLVDGLYGFVWFTCPRMVYLTLKRN
ncbi:MAG: hypothetical protein JSS30_02270 [Verrucomicrobia bacterium]|nr:hypothetical protein [Verrucomicrobiota bacterium]